MQSKHAFSFSESECSKKIQNYKPTSFPGLQIKGTEISEPLNSIRPGYTEGFYSQQAAYASRTEGLMAWHVTGETVCIIYWYVQSDQSGIRHPNRLGLGCQENRDNTSDMIDRIVEDPSLINDYVTVRYFKHEPYPMQYCNSLFCLSGIVGTDTRVKAEVDLFPRDLVNWNTNTRAQTDQEEINSWILTTEEGTKNHEAKAYVRAGNICMYVFAPLGAIALVSVVVILVYYRVKGRFPWD